MTLQPAKLSDQEAIFPAYLFLRHLVQPQVSTRTQSQGQHTHGRYLLTSPQNCLATARDLQGKMANKCAFGKTITKKEGSRAGFSGAPSVSQEPWQWSVLNGKITTQLEQTARLGTMQGVHRFIFWNHPFHFVSLFSFVFKGEGNWGGEPCFSITLPDIWEENKRSH